VVLLVVVLAHEDLAAGRVEAVVADLRRPDAVVVLDVDVRSTRTVHVSGEREALEARRPADIRCTHGSWSAK
jgi:hypothetical protein